MNLAPNFFFKLTKIRLYKITLKCKIRLCIFHQNNNNNVINYIVFQVINQPTNLLFYNKFNKLYGIFKAILNKFYI